MRRGNCVRWRARDCISGLVVEEIEFAKMWAPAGGGGRKLARRRWGKDG